MDYDKEEVMWWSVEMVEGIGRAHEEKSKAKQWKINGKVKRKSRKEERSHYLFSDLK